MTSGNTVAQRLSAAGASCRVDEPDWVCCAPFPVCGPQPRHLTARTGSRWWSEDPNWIGDRRILVPLWSSLLLLWASVSPPGGVGFLEETSKVLAPDGRSRVGSGGREAATSRGGADAGAGSSRPRGWHERSRHWPRPPPSCSGGSPRLGAFVRAAPSSWVTLPLSSSPQPASPDGPGLPWLVHPGPAIFSVLSRLRNTAHRS